MRGLVCTVMRAVPSEGRFSSNVDRSVPRESPPAEPFEVTKQLASELALGTGIDGAVSLFLRLSRLVISCATDGVAEVLDETQFTLSEGPRLGFFPFRQSGIELWKFTGRACAE